MLKRLFLVSLVVCSNVYSQSPTGYIPSKAFKYSETILEETYRYFNEIPEWNYPPSLIEHESCISLKHKRCWEPTSQLKSKREEGAGLGQLTRAYNEDGSIRFDSLTNMRNAYKRELREMSWDNIYSRPDLQIRTIVLMLRDSYKRLYNVKDEMERLKMTDAAYNGGLGGVLKERRACGMSSECNPDVWFKNVERFCLKSKKVLYGNRSACDINRDHVKDVFNNRLPKYKRQYYLNVR